MDYVGVTLPCPSCVFGAKDGMEDKDSGYSIGQAAQMVSSGRILTAAPQVNFEPGLGLLSTASLIVMV